MIPVGKVVSECEIHAPAHQFYKLFKHETFNIPKCSPTYIQKVEHQGGDWDSHGHGSIKIWNYTTPDGKPGIFKEQMKCDDNKLTITMIGLEGDMFKEYKKFIPTFQVIPKGPEHSSVVMSLEYEKVDDNVPCPYKYLDIMNSVTKGIESHLKK